MAGYLLTITVQDGFSEHARKIDLEVGKLGFMSYFIDQGKKIRLPKYTYVREDASPFWSVQQACKAAKDIVLQIDPAASITVFEKGRGVYCYFRASTAAEGKP